MLNFKYNKAILSALAAAATALSVGAIDGKLGLADVLAAIVAALGSLGIVATVPNKRGMTQ